METLGVDRPQLYIWMFCVAKIAQGSHELFQQKPIDLGVEEISATSAATSENRHRPDETLQTKIMSTH